MSLSIYLAFVGASALLMIIPGPNVALITANSMAYGVRAGLMTVFGTSAAMVIQLTLTVLGLSGALLLFSHWFEALRWIGVAYLIYLGIKAWSAPPANLAARAEPLDLRRMFWRGFLVSLTNPKTLFFYGAFFPQFVAPSGNVPLQLTLLAATFLLVAVILDGGWAVLAYRARGALGIGGRALNRLTGGLLLAAATGLALARKS